MRGGVLLFKIGSFRFVTNTTTNHLVKTFGMSPYYPFLFPSIKSLSCLDPEKDEL